MEWTLAVAFWGVSMLFVIVPGVDWAYAIASGLRHRVGVLPAVSGMLAGHFAATLLVAAGVAALLATSTSLMTVLTIAGAAYLTWLGVSTLRHPAAPDLDAESAPAGRGRLFTRGLGVSLLNPKVFLLFLALLPGFASSNAALPVGAQMLVLGTLHIANCAIVYFAVGYGASVVLTRRPRAAKIVTIASGVAMIVLGAALTGEKIAEWLN